MKECRICKVLMCDNAVYCMRGHKQEFPVSDMPDIPDFVNDLFGGFDKKQPKDCENPK